MPRQMVLLLLLALALTAQQGPSIPTFPSEPPAEVRLPNGKLEREETLRSDYQKTLEDARALSKLAEELRADLEKSDYNILSVGMLKKSDDIDRLAQAHSRPAEAVLICYARTESRSTEARPAGPRR